MRFKLLQKSDLESEDGVLTPHGMDIAHRYAVAWLGGQRSADLENRYPELETLFYDIRGDAQLAQEHAMAKSQKFVLPLSKAVPQLAEKEPQQPRGGPYTGPRGGKWADPDHTIPWKEGSPRKPGQTEEAKGRPTAKQDDARPKRNWVTMKDMGLPENTQAAYKQGGRYVPQRQQLHNQIIAKFTGHVPSVPQGMTPIAVVMMGGPAAGKSTLVKKLLGSAQDFVNVNPDDVKEQLPEFQQATSDHRQTAKDAAFAVHEESSDVSEMVMQHATSYRKNLIKDGTGKNAESYKAMIADLKSRGYVVHVVMPDIDAEEAVKRVEDRAEKTGRYVPENIVREAHAVIPGNFEQIARSADAFALFNSRKDPPEEVWSSGDGHEVVHDPKFVEEFKQRGAEGLRRHHQERHGLKLTKAFPMKKPSNQPPKGAPPAPSAKPGAPPAAAKPAAGAAPARPPMVARQVPQGGAAPAPAAVPAGEGMRGQAPRPAAPPIPTPGAAPGQPPQPGQPPHQATAGGPPGAPQRPGQPQPPAGPQKGPQAPPAAPGGMPGQASHGTPAMSFQDVLGRLKGAGVPPEQNQVAPKGEEPEEGEDDKSRPYKGTNFKGGEGIIWPVTD